MALEVVDLYHRANETKVENFRNQVSSDLRVVASHDRVECNYEWLDMMEEAICYIDNILRNPNRFIVNEEDIIKIELARRIGVESIKHLARNTNLIQDYNKKTGDVKPSKILNITKEESFDTYENRFIYSLVQNMRMYIERKKNYILEASSYKENKKFAYRASTSVGREKVNMALDLDTSLKEEQKNVDEQGNTIPERIEKLELQISDLMNSEVYKTLDKKHISLVTSPIKKTNVILKNVNFQYAVKLWNYMQEHYNDNTTRDKKNEDYQDDGHLKKYLDESFLLDYLVIDSISKKKQEVTKQELTERLVGNMVEKLVDLDIQISDEQLKDIVARQYTKIQYRNVINDKEIKKKFKTYLDKYLDRVEEVKI